MKLVNKGFDPRELVLVVGGGVGPVHAAALAGTSDMDQVYILKHTAVFCSFGIMLADYKYILSRFYYRSDNGISISTKKSS